MNKKALSAFLAMSTIAGVATPAVGAFAEEKHSVEELIASAKGNKTLYHYNQAYAAIEADKENPEYTNRLAELAPVVEQIKGAKEMFKAIDEMIAIQTSKSLEAYAAIEAKIPTMNIDDVDKQYLATELVKYTRPVIWDQQSDMTKVMDKVNEASKALEAGKVKDARKAIDEAKKVLADEKNNIEKVNEDYLNKDAVTPVEAKIVKAEAEGQYELRLTTNAKDNTIVANGADNTVITAELIDKETGKVDENADNMVLAFSATYGNLANTRVVVQDGVATVTFTSEFSQKDLVSKIDAQVIEASEDYKDLIGKVVATTNVNLVTSTGQLNPDKKPALVAAESNQADRVTLNFNQIVSVDEFAKVAKDGKFEVDGEGNYVPADGFKELKITQNKDAEAKKIRGFRAVPGNSKAIEVILDKEDVLEDNKNVHAELTMNSNVGDQKTEADFILTDARKPEATSVVAEDLKTVKVKFSESIASADIKLDGGITKYAKVEFGDFDQATLQDNRNIMTIKTTDYLKSGDHSIQLSSIKDFAAATDDKNISTSQSLDFKVKADDKTPTAKVTVESPEQFRIRFNTFVEKFEEANLKLERKDKDGKWVEAKSEGYYTAPTFKITQPDEKIAEYVVELNEDWTEVYNTKATKLNYYNDEYRLVVAEKEVTNPSNGKTNEAIEMPLDSDIMKSADTKSPEIKGFSATTKVDTFDVEMSEPVKLFDKDNNDTVSQFQGSVPKTVVEFLGKDKDGKAITVQGTVLGYGDKDGADKIVRVAAVEEESIQKLVNKGASEDWTVVVRSISDDIGNTAASLTHNFKVKADTTVETDVFKVKDAKYNGVTGKLEDETKDTIQLVFTSGVQYTGTSKNAVNPSNYLLDGESLPKGTSIELADSNNNKEDGYDTVVITLPDGTLSKDHNNVITVSKSLESYKNTELTGAYEVSFKSIDNVAEEAKIEVAKKALEDAKIEQGNKVQALAGAKTEQGNKIQALADVKTEQGNKDQALADAKTKQGEKAQAVADAEEAKTAAETGDQAAKDKAEADLVKANGEKAAADKAVTDAEEAKTAADKAVTDAEEAKTAADKAVADAEEAKTAADNAVAAADAKLKELQRTTK